MIRAHDYEPFSERARLDPYPFYRALRDESPVHWAPEAGAWIVSRYEDVRFVLKHADCFSSDAMGGVLTGTPDRIRTGEPTRVIILMDPPQHAAMRNTVSRGFTPRRIAMLEPRVREIVDEAMAPLRGRSDFDLVAELAVPIPLRVIAELLGVETDRIADFRAWSKEIISGVSGSRRGEVGTDGTLSFAGGIAAFSEYLSGMIERRRLAPEDDLISVLVQAEDGEMSLGEQEIIFFGVVLLIAGNETTTNLLGSAVRILSERPDLLALVQRDRSLVPGLIEETLRFESPIQFVFRRATRDVEIAGTRIPADGIVIPLLGSANRDERQFDRADEFDPRRNRDDHVAFGFGNHFCLGASLARLEARLILEVLLDELPAFHRIDRVCENIDSFMMRGPRRLGLRRAA